MNRMLVVIFDNETAAEVGTRALKHLDTEGAISLYAMAVVAKDAAGQVSVKESTDPVPVGTGVGLAVGGIVGLLGGPIGVALGAAAGSFIGAVRDFWVTGVGLDFVEETDQFLKPGKVAVIAEIEEEWVIPVDSRMEAAGGTVFRRERTDVAEAHFNRDVSVLKTEIADLKAEAEHASAETKSKLQKKINTAKLSLDKTLQNAKHRVDELEQESKDRVGLLENRFEKAKGAAKAKLDARVTSVRRAYVKRGAKLKQAWGIAKEAVTS